jgi:hypothetical protein
VDIPDPFKLPEELSVNSTDLGEDLSQLDSLGLKEPEEGTVSVPKEYKAEPVGDSDQWDAAMASTTTISVHALVKKSQRCLMNSKKGAACYSAKKVRCEKICFLVGNTGVGSRGELVRTQAFTADECPTKQQMKSARLRSNATEHNKAPGEHDVAWRIPRHSNVTEPAAANATVTLEVVAQDLPSSATEAEKKHYLQENYNSEDLNLRRCCFPGCEIPRQVLAGKYYANNNPWYWYDRDTPLSHAAGLQFAYN